MAKCGAAILLVAAMFCGMALSSPSQAGGGPVRIRLATEARLGMRNFQPLQNFKEHVELASNGGIRVEIYYSGQMFPGAGAGPAVMSGAVEMADINLSRYAAAIPIADAFQLPFLFNTDDLEKTALAPGSEIRLLIERSIHAEARSRVLWWISLGPTVFLSHGKSAAAPASIAGKPVRTFGPITAKLVTGCGGIPRDTGGEAEEKGYERRDAEFGMTGLSNVIERRLWRYMDTVTQTHHASTQAVVVINDAFWQSLSGEHRAILTMAANAADTESRMINAEVQANAHLELMHVRRAKVVNLTGDELQQWRICSSDVLENFLAKAGPAGEELMLAYGRMRKEPGAAAARVPVSGAVAIQRPPAAPR